MLYQYSYVPGGEPKYCCRFTSVYLIFIKPKALYPFFWWDALIHQEQGFHPHFLSELLHIDFFQTNGTRPR